MDTRLYFAYGSNINLDQMACRCPDAQVVGPVTLENYELLFRRGGCATIMPCEGGKVHGLLWSLTPDCERSLDRYEGYPRFYDKRMVTVRGGLGRELSVMAYIMDVPGTDAADQLLLQRHPGGLPAERPAGVRTEKSVGSCCAGGPRYDETDKQFVCPAGKTTETAGRP